MSLARHIAVMRNAAFLRALDDEALKLLAFGSEAVALKPRDILFESGEPADGAVLVLGGQLRLVRQNEVGEPRVVSVGALVDDLALIAPKTRSQSAMAQTSCEVLLLPRSHMLRILEEYPASAARLQAVITKRTSAMVTDLTGLADRAFRDA